MKLNESLLPELDQEMGNTRKVLERVPADKFAWKPHAKSFPMGALAQHVATIPLWGTMTIEDDHFDLTGPRSSEFPPPVSSQKELLALFDANATKFRTTLAAAADAKMLAPWSLKKGGQMIFTMPRIAVLRSFVMNHLIHHRAQLGVYLRLIDVPVPGLYGPSADEK